MRRLPVLHLALLATVLFIGGCKSNNKGKIEGTKWTSLAATVKGTPIPAGTLQLEFTTDGKMVYKIGQKTITGTYYGSAHPRQDMPRIADWVERGLVDVASLVTRRYTLAEINRAYEDIETDAVGRGVIVFA